MDVLLRLGRKDQIDAETRLLQGLPAPRIIVAALGCTRCRRRHQGVVGILAARAWPGRTQRGRTFAALLRVKLWPGYREDRGEIGTVSTKKTAKKSIVGAIASPGTRPPERTGRAAIDQNYFKIYAPWDVKRELRIESMDAGKRTARYCLEIIEERLPYDVREAVRARAEEEGRTVQNIILQALAKDGIAEAEPYLADKKKR